MRYVGPEVEKISLSRDNEERDVRFWPVRSADERVEAVAVLREQYFRQMDLNHMRHVEKSVSKRPAFER